jgi:hypothetical protein
MKRMLVTPRICKRDDGSTYIEMDQEEIDVEDPIQPEPVKEENPYFSFTVSFSKEEMTLSKEEFIKVIDEKIQAWKDILLWQNELIVECEKIEKERK